MAGFVECLDSEDTEEFVRLEEGMSQINVYFLFYVNKKTVECLVVTQVILRICQHNSKQTFGKRLKSELNVTANQVN